MRKRSVQEIIEATVTGSFNRQKRINQEKRRKALEKVAQQRSADQNKKPDLATARIRDLEARTDLSRARRDAVVAAEKRKKDQADKAKKDQDFDDKKASVSSKEKFADNIAGKKPNLEKISSKDKSVSATGKAAMNLAKSATSIGRKVASIPTRMVARKDKEDLGKAQMQKNQAPTSGTTRQKVGYAARPVTRAVSNAAKNIRRATGRGVEKVGKRIIPEDFIHEAENDKKEIKKEKIDVMKGTNKIEVNPKVQAEAKKMTKSQIEKRDEIADAISTREMNKRYGDKNVKYAIATKLAMKKKKKKKISEAKVDKEKSPIYSLPRTQARNERRFGKKGSLEPQGFFGQKPSEAAELSKKRTDEHKARRGVKNESVSGLEVQNVSDGIKFREYEFIDVVKPEPMRSPKNNITWTEEVGPDGEGLTPSQQRKGLGMSGSGIRKLKKDMVKKGNFNVKKNLAKNTSDEQHTTTTNEETINEISADLAGKAAMAASKKYQYADSNETKNKAYKQTQKFATYADKKYRKLNKDRYDLNKIYNKEEAKAPVGLMKLAAMVADNNKKRKNALQIQKYIGEDKKMGRQSDEALAAAHKKFSNMDQTSPANSFMTKRIQKEIDRRKKANPKPEVKNEETIVEKQGGDKKKPDTKINYRTAFTQDRVLNSTPDEERGVAKRKSTAEMIRQKKRDEVQKKKDAFKKKRKGLMAKGEIKSPDSK